MTDHIPAEAIEAAAKELARRALPDSATLDDRLLAVDRWRRYEWEARQVLAEALPFLRPEPSEDDREALSRIFQAHYLDTLSARVNPDNLSSCICGEWSEGEMEPGWDDHMAEVAMAAGFTRRPMSAQRQDRTRLIAGARTWDSAITQAAPTTTAALIQELADALEGKINE